MMSSADWSPQPSQFPLAMGYGMFAFVSLGDKYFAYGALAGLYTAFIVAVVSVLLGDRTPTVYAPRINSTVFLGALLYGLVHSGTAVLNTAGIASILLVFFSTVLLGGSSKRSSASSKSAP
jgi:SulP family sulfate permease